ncbi:unnamed protein product [Leuciscus chuanchicus]
MRNGYKKQCYRRRTEAILRSRSPEALSEEGPRQATRVKDFKCPERADSDSDMVPPELPLKFLKGRQLMCQLDNFQGAIRRNLGLHFGRVEYCPQEPRSGLGWWGGGVVGWAQNRQQTQHFQCPEMKRGLEEQAHFEGSPASAGLNPFLFRPEASGLLRLHGAQF